MYTTNLEAKNSKLNPHQEEAVNHISGPLLVLAGAGSGKTRVVTCHIIALINQGVLPENIMALTFTNKAAKEMKERVHKMTSTSVMISTFHSLGARILRESIEALGYTSSFVIYDQEDSLKMIRRCLKECNISEKEASSKSIKNLISKVKNDLQTSPESIVENSSLQSIFPNIYESYQQKLKESNAVDFDDLLYLPVQLFTQFPEILERYQNRWLHLLVDEYQDTNMAQYTLAHLLISKTKNFFVVGDPDQSIYTWRGANINNILNFKKDWPGAKVIKLEQNYRSTCNILNGANAVIQQNHSRYEKNLWSNLGEGDLITLYQSQSEYDEAEFVINKILSHRKKEDISYNSFALFYRTNAQSRSFEDLLLKNNLPYVVIGGISFYQRKEVKDILAYLRMVEDGNDFISFQRTINLPKRGIGDATIQKLAEGAISSGKSFYEFCKALIENSISYPIRLSIKQREGLKNYTETLQKLKKLKIETSLANLVSEAINSTKYLDYLRSDQETFDDRKQNLDELIAKATEWEEENETPSLEAFLEELTLKTSLDESSSSTEKISLMTAHNGKGLEFPIVFIVGMEEMLFPHINSQNSIDEIEEERRLCYVGMTRAKQKLYITYSKSRFIWGSIRYMRPSRFIKEIPKIYIEHSASEKSRFNSYNPASEATISSNHEYSIGDAVFHKTFGIGKIVETGSCSSGETYTVVFNKDNSKKTLVAKYANLSKL